MSEPKLLAEMQARILNVLLAVFFSTVFVAGVYDVFVSEPLAPIDQGLSGPYYTLWSLGNIAAPVLWFTGRVVAYPLPWFRFGGNAYASLVFCFFGTAAYAGVLSVYVTTTFVAAYWGKAIYAGFLCVGLAFCFLVVAGRDGWLLYRFERPARQLRRAARK